MSDCESDTQNASEQTPTDVTDATDATDATVSLPKALETCVGCTILNSRGSGPGQI